MALMNWQLPLITAYSERIHYLSQYLFEWSESSLQRVCRLLEARDHETTFLSTS